MEFKDKHSIYIQIADRVCEKILLGIFREEDKIPSTREMAIELEVNPNTVIRTYEYLEQKEIIYNRRGIGYFIAANAKQKVMETLQNPFLEETLPDVFKTILLLEIDFKEVTARFEQYKAGFQNKTKKNIDAPEHE
jgi:DNA-binding transcriptional regulator YhcF (GntR family)